MTTLNDYNLKDGRGWVSQEENPRILHDEVVYTRLDLLPRNPNASNCNWTLAGVETYDAHPGVLPRIGCYFFSASGSRAASMIPRDGYPTRYPSDVLEVYPRNDLISRISLSAVPDPSGTAETLKATFVLQEQAETIYESTYNNIGNDNVQEPEFSPYATSYSSADYITGSSSAIVAIDYDGEDEIYAVAHYGHSSTSQGETISAGEIGYFAYSESSNMSGTVLLSLDIGSDSIVMLEQSFASTFAYAYDGNPSDTSSIHRNQTSALLKLNPAYLDLRTKCYIFIVEDQTVVHDSSFTYLGMFSADWGTASSDSTNGVLNFGINIAGTVVAQQTHSLNHSYAAQSDDDGSRGGGWNPPLAGRNGSSSETFAYPVSISNLFRQDFYSIDKDDYFGRRFEMPLFGIAGDNAGEVLVDSIDNKYCPYWTHRMVYPTYPYWEGSENAYAQYSNTTAFDFVHFSGGNIDAIYAAYQSEKYPPNPNNPDDPNNTVDTAMESRMMAKFTV